MIDKLYKIELPKIKFFLLVIKMQIFKIVIFEKKFKLVKKKFKIMFCILLSI